MYPHTMLHDAELSEYYCGNCYATADKDDTECYDCKQSFDSVFEIED